MSTFIGSNHIYRDFTNRQHNWAMQMSINLLKMSVLVQGMAHRRSATIPSVGLNNEVILNTVTGNIHVFTGGTWYEMEVRVGTQLFISAEQVIVRKTISGWVVDMDANIVHPDIERSFNVYVPGKISPRSPVFLYVPTLEFFIPAGAPGCGAQLDVAPTATIVFPIIGTTLYVNLPPETVYLRRIRFEAGSTTGVWEQTTPLVAQATDIEHKTRKPRPMTINSPPDLYGAEGLRLTICGKIRGMK